MHRQGIIFLLLMLTLCAPGAARRPLTVEDTLRLESITDAETSPDGRYMLLIKEPASLSRKDFARDTIFGPKTGTLIALDLRGKLKPRALIDVAGEGYALGPFSPDSTRVLVYWTADRKLGLGCYDFETGRFTRFATSPQLNSRTDFHPLWLSNEEIIYAGEADGEQPFELFDRPEVARRSNDLWARSWSGKVPGVVISQSRSDGGGDRSERGMLVRANVRTGRAVTIADGVYSDLRLSWDGRYVAALRHYSSGQPPVSRNDDWTFQTRTELVVFDRRSGRPSFESHGLTVGLGSLQWAPRSDKIAFFAWSPAGSSDAGLYHVYDASAHQLTVRPHRGLDLVSERERGWFPRPERAAWLEDGIAVAARAEDSPSAPPAFVPKDASRSGTSEPGIGWFLLEAGGKVRPLTPALENVSPVLVEADVDRLVVIADGRLWAITPDGPPRRLLDAYDGLSIAFPPTIRTNVAKNPLLLEQSQNGKIAYLIPDLSGGSPVVRVDLGPNETLLAAAPDGTALLANTAHARTDILINRGAQRQPVMRLNAFLDGVDLGQRREISYLAPSGKALTGCVMLPPGYVKGRAYPTIVITYPGLPGPCPPASIDFFSDEELLAAHGYVVLRPGNPVEAIRTADGPIAGMPAVVESAIDAALAAGYSDPQRLGLWGVSQGGWSSLWLATQMKQFKAVVSAQGWTDLPSHYLGADHQQLFFPEYMPYAMNTVRYEPPAGSEQSIGKTLWQAPDIYVKNSSTMHADKVTAPVMLIGSDMDIFPLWQYQEMYTALYRLRKPACLVVYMGEGHWPQSPANVRDLWERAFAWFDFHLRHAVSNGCADPDVPPATAGPAAR